MKKSQMALGLVLGISFATFAFVDDADAASNMNRLYNPNSGEHFYTKDNSEKNNLVKHGWKYEGIGWVAPDTGADVYRLYNKNAGDHHYTTNFAEKNNLVKLGWKYEGVGWKSDTYKGVKLHRAYNPNAKAGSHNYTINYAEQQNLIKHGWKNEGTAWFGMNPNQKFNIKVVHKGSDGKVLNQQTVAVKRDNNYKASAKSFNGYKLKGASSQTVKADGNKTITFNYTKNSTPAPTKYTVSVQYKEAGGKLLTATIDKFTVEKGKEFTANAKTFNNYTLKGAKTQTITVSKDTTITFEYTFNQPNKTELQNLYNKLKGTQKGNYTDATWKNFQEALTIAKAALDSNNVMQSDVDTVKNDLQEAFNNLKTNTPVEKFNVIVVHKGNDGTTLNKETPVKVEKGKTFTGYSKTFTGYTLSGNSSQTITVNANATITFNYNKNVEEDLTTIAKQVAGSSMGYINSYRKSSNSSLVNIDVQPTIQSYAMVRAQEISTLYDHVRPNGAPVLSVPGYGGATGENIGRFRNVPLDWIKTQGAQQLVNAWINSSAHASYLRSVNVNEGGVGAYITKNSNGTYNLYFTYLGAENPNKPVSGYAVRVTHKLNTGKQIGMESLQVTETKYTPRAMTRALIDGKVVDVEAINLPTVDLTGASGETQITVTYRLK